MTTSIQLDDLRDMWREVQAEKTPPGEAAPLPSSPGVEEPVGGEVPPSLSADRRSKHIDTVRAVLLLATGQELDHVSEWIVDELEALA